MTVSIYIVCASMALSICGYCTSVESAFGKWEVWGFAIWGRQTDITSQSCSHWCIPCFLAAVYFVSFPFFGVEPIIYLNVAWTDMGCTPEICICMREFETYMVNQELSPSYFVVLFSCESTFCVKAALEWGQYYVDHNVDFKLIYCK